MPGGRALTPWNMTPESEWGPSQFAIRSLLRDVATDFDVVLIDCPPNLHLCSWAALTASDAVVVPLQAEDYGAQGIYDITGSVAAVQGATNPDLRLLGFLITMFDKRTALHTAYQDQLRTLYGDKVFSSVVPRAKDYPEAVSARMPIAFYKPKSAAAKAIQAVAEELVARAEALSAGRTAA